MVTHVSPFLLLTLPVLAAVRGVLECDALSSSPPPPLPSPVLVIGASGGTGLRALEGLLDAGYKPEDIRVLSRNINKPSVVALRESMGFTTVQADLDEYDEEKSKSKSKSESYPLENAMEGCVGVYIHSTSSDTKKLDRGEEDRAKNLVNAISKSGSTIRHVVYNSAVGEEGHGVERIAQKHAVEDIFMNNGNDMNNDMNNDVSFTSLRANFFMEELWKSYIRPGILKGKFSFSVPPEREIYLTSVRDMGHLAGECLRSPDTTMGRTINVAGDKVSVQDMAAAFSVAQGSPCVHSNNRVLAVLARLFFRDLYQIIRFYKTTTEVTDIDKLRKEFPNVVTSFPKFLDETDWGNQDRSYEALNKIVKTTGTKLPRK